MTFKEILEMKNVPIYPNAPFKVGTLYLVQMNSTCSFQPRESKKIQ